VRSTSAILWSRPARNGKVRLLVARDRALRRGPRRYLLSSRKSNDYTVQRTVRGLRPARRYWFRFRLAGGTRSRLGTFRTAPKRQANETIEFAWTADTNLGRRGDGTPIWNGGDIFRQMRRERNDFDVHLGDTVYVGSVPRTELEPKWRKYRRNLANRHLAALRRSGPFYSHWDDHEFFDNFSRGDSFVSNGVIIGGEFLYRRARRAFLDYSPVSYSSSRGLYRSFRWGRNLELFFLDARSFRDPTAAQGGACINPQTGRRDFVPTAPQPLRDRLADVLPTLGLTHPVQQVCLDRISDPDRDLLGDVQFDRFTSAIDRSTARWKVVMNEVPIQQYYALPYDRWEGYAAERQRLLRFLQQNVGDLIFLSADVHGTLVGDARLQTLEPDGPEDSGILEVTAGPAASTNLAQELDRWIGRPGTGTLVDAAVLEPPPPDGVGMRCSIVNAFGYGQVRVTEYTLTVTAKGIDGKPLPGCAPVVLYHQ
jgi:alkaline phosphatase D